METIGQKPTDLEVFAAKDGMRVSIKIEDGHVMMKNEGTPMNMGQLIVLLQTALISAVSYTEKETAKGNDAAVKNILH